MEARSRSNQQAMEQALGKLVIDAGFRDAFFSDPGVASEAAGIPLSDRERAALTRIRPGALAAFQRYLDRKKILANSVAAAACGMLLLAAPGHAQLPLQQPPTAQTESTTAAVIRPFRVNVVEAALVDLHRRIAATRWPDRETVTDQSQGILLAKLQELVRYWGTGYDWRKAEAKLNALPQFVTTIDGVDIHLVHVRSRHPSALPLI